MINIANRLLIQIPLTVSIAFLFDFAVQLQMKFMITIMRRVPYRFYYSFGPPLKILLIFLCLVPINIGLAYPDAPDSVLGPSVVISVVVYAAYVWFLSGRENRQSQ